MANNSDKPNGKVTQMPGTQPIPTRTEVEAAVAQAREVMPAFIQKIAVDAEILRGKYDALVAAGFDKKEALEIVKTRPLYE